MRPLRHKVRDQHCFKPVTNRERENKLPKSAGERKGQKSAYRMRVRKEVKLLSDAIAS